MSNTRRWLTAYVIALVVFCGLDLIWIAAVASGLYRSQLGDLLADQFNLPAAGLFYLGFVAVLVHLAIRPLQDAATTRQRVASAALFGFATYGTWALTAFALLRDFPAVVATTDIAWGVLLCSLVTWTTTGVLRRLPRQPERPSPSQSDPHSATAG